MSASISRAFRAGALGALVAAGMAAAPLGAAQAQQQVASRVDAKDAWSIFTADVDGKVCWIVSEPTTSTARKGGKVVQVRRGDIYLMVSVRPGQGVKNEISMVAGYPFKPGSEVKATIGSQTYEMFTKGENAWLDDPSIDDRMVVAMKKGITAKLVGVSSRGTQTEDTFSLRGFTAAITLAQDLCK
ncbi:invasion associated locus B family protein [Rhodovulum sp. DZ06]|uniref:invasion associated locus B family protein n=1 Tax=Rhodovulum sp. DZ06 TaxID=3425126 RepID=UPI003D32B1C5